MIRAVITFTTFLAFAGTVSATMTFVHPGTLDGKAELDFIAGDNGNVTAFWSNPTQWVDGLTQETCRDNNHHAQFGMSGALGAMVPSTNDSRNGTYGSSVYEWKHAGHLRQ